MNRRGGVVSDYYAIHSFLDSTKELCSDNRHRILHNLWGVRRIVIPIFGSVIVNSDQKQVNVKDLCEQDHILPDFSNKFIPTLGDFVDSMDELTAEEENRINSVHQDYSFLPAELELLLSPLHLTGQLKSLLITHNSWFVNSILRKVFARDVLLQDFPLSPQLLFEKIRFQAWMDNGRAGYPRSVNSTKQML